jgi:hypothetical protein
MARLRTMPFWRVLLIFLALLIIQHVLFVAAARQLGAKEEAGTNIRFEKLAKDIGPVLIFIVAGLFIPWMETLFFQCLLMELVLMALPKDRPWRGFAAVILSAAVFSIVHRYSAVYMLGGFLSGAVFASAYYVGKGRRELAVCLPYALHAVWNTGMLSIRYLFGH